MISHNLSLRGGSSTAFSSKQRQRFARGAKNNNRSAVVVALPTTTTTATKTTLRSNNAQFRSKNTIRCDATSPSSSSSNSSNNNNVSGIKGDVAITGATGVVGTRLVRRLASRGVKVRVLTRDPKAAAAKLAGIPRVTFFAKKDWAGAIDGALGGVVNLAGEPIATRWSPALKAEIRRSRLDATRAVADAILAAKQRPPVLVSSSAVGFYGTSETASFSESAPPGDDFLAKLCVEWEAEAARAAGESRVDSSGSPPTRVVTIRTGIVLAKEGGALAKMLPVFSLFAGGPLGSGNQICSWIHIDDLVSLFVEALANPSYRGAYNGTAPSPVRMSELCSELGATLGRPSWLPVPEFALTTLLGGGASVVLEGQRVIPTRALEQNFSFRHGNVSEALRNLYR